MVTIALAAGLSIVLIGLAAPIGYADVTAGERKAQLCLLCHKPNNPMAYVPTLEGQPWQYLYNQVKAYQEKRRPDDVMQTNVAWLTDRDVRDIADYFASRDPIRTTFDLDPGKVALGRSRANDLRCAMCHRADFAGHGDAPRLAGLDPRYGARQIVDFVSGKRRHPHVSGMAALSREDAEGLAHFFAQLE